MFCCVIFFPQVLTGDDIDLPNDDTEDHILEGAVGGQVEDTETTQDISSDAQNVILFSFFKVIFDIQLYSLYMLV